MSSLQINRTEGERELPFFVQPTVDDSVQNHVIHKNRILFIGYDHEHETCIHYLSDDGVEILFPALSVKDLTDRLWGV